MSESHDIDEDLALVERILAAPEGDTRAFDVLVQRHQKDVMANCRYITRAPGDAEDLAQDVFVKVYFSLKRFEGRSKFRTWLRRIKANHCLNHLRRAEGKTFVDLEETAASPPEELRTEPQAWSRLEAAAEQDKIAEIIDKMNDTLRLPLILRDMDEMSYQEIADILGIGLSAVKMRINRARREFRERYEAVRRGGGD